MTAAASGIIAALFASLLWGGVTRTVVMSPEIQVAGAFLAVWVPLGGTVIACLSRRRRSPAPALGLRLTWLDVLYGIALGLLARTAVGILELVSSGRIAGFGVRLDPPEGLLLWFGVLLAPIVIGPIIEEVFFRGLVLRSVERSTAAGMLGRADMAGRADTAGRTDSERVVAASIAVVVSSLVFALLHVAQTTSISEAWRIGGASLVFGLAAGAVTVLTGRLGAAVIAHVVFNGSLIVAVLLA